MNLRRAWPLCEMKGKSFRWLKLRIRIMASYRSLCHLSITPLEEKLVLGKQDCPWGSWWPERVFLLLPSSLATNSLGKGSGHSGQTGRTLRAHWQVQAPLGSLSTRQGKQQQRVLGPGIGAPGEQSALGGQCGPSPVHLCMVLRASARSCWQSDLQGGRWYLRLAESSACLGVYLEFYTPGFDTVPFSSLLHNHYQLDPAA